MYSIKVLTKGLISNIIREHFIDYFIGGSKMTTKKKAIEDRSNTIRVQYTTEDQIPSSITIEGLIFQLLEKQVGDAKSWLKGKAKEKRSELLREATQISKGSPLVKKVSGKLVEITPDEYVRGKVSASVRESAIMEIAKESLISQINIDD